jgi:hypothetical protein
LKEMLRGCSALNPFDCANCSRALFNSLANGGMTSDSWAGETTR